MWTIWRLVAARRFLSTGLASAWAVSLASLLLPQAVFASDQNAFYRTHTLTIGVPAGAGSNYDLYVRTIARYLGKYIPGSPTVVTTNVPGGGGLVLANQLANSWPKDGSFAAIIPGPAIEYELIGDPQVHFQSRKLNWIGNMNRLTQTCIVSKQSRIADVADLFTRDVMVGASAVGADSYTLPTAYDMILGTRLKVVTGYSSASDIVMAMQNGELMGGCGVDVSQLQSQFSSSLKDGKIKFLMQAGLKSDERFPNVPNVVDLAKTPKARQQLEVLLLPDVLGKPIAMPAEAPADRVKLVRDGFDKAMKDSQFLADMQTAKLDTRSMTSDEVSEALSQLFSATPASITMLRSLLSRS